MMDKGPGFKDKKVVPLHHLVSVYPNSIRGGGLQKKKITLDS